MKAILLVRVSTQKQSFDEQEKQLYDMAIADGYQDEDIILIAEKESGIKLSEDERAGLNKMKQIIQTDNSINCVYCWEVSRIARKKKVSFSVLDFLQSRHIQLIIKTPFIKLFNEDGSTNEGAEIVFTLFSQMAESEMRTKLARWKRTKDANRKQSIFVGGSVLFGYCPDKVSGKIVVDKKQGELVKRIYNMYASGEHSTISISKELLSDGTFDDSLHSIIRRVTRIVNNPAYCGGESNRASITGGYIYPSIVSKELFQTVQAAKEYNRTNEKKVFSEIYYGKRILKCSDCGHSLSVKKGQVVYSCMNVDCDNKNTYPANLIDWTLWNAAIYFYIQNWKNTAPTERQKVQDSMSLIEKKMTVNEKQHDKILSSIDRLEERLIIGNLSGIKAKELQTRFDKELSDIEVDKQQLMNRLSSLKNKLSAVSNINILDMNQLLEISDDKTRFDIIKDNVSKAIIQRIKKGLCKLDVYLKPKFECDEEIQSSYYLYTLKNKVYRSFIFDGENGVDFNPDDELSKESQMCLFLIGKPTIHQHKEGGHMKKYRKEYNKNYRLKRKDNFNEYMRKYREEKKKERNALNSNDDKQ